MIIIFISIVSIILAIIHIVIYKVLVSIFMLSVGKVYLGWIIAILGASFIAASILSSYFDNIFSRLYYTISASWLGIVTYLFIISIIYALVLLVAKVFSSDISLNGFGIVLVCAALLVSIYGLIHARSIIVKNIEVTIPNIPESWKTKTAVFVSDVHLGAVRGKSFSQDIVDKINAEHPDIVFIGGDLYDGVKVDEKDIIAPFSGLAAPLGTYFVTGNHEEFRDSGDYISAIKGAGIRVLDNESVNIEGLTIVGVDDKDSTDKTKFSHILAGLQIDKTKPSILLRHQPNLLDIAHDAGVTFQISGHTHKAQIFPLNIFSYYIFKGYDYGLKDYSGMGVYTSSGVGTWGPPMRVGSDGEVVVIKFR